MVGVDWIDMADCCEHCNEPSDATAGGEQLEQFMDFWVVNKDSAKS